MAVGGRRLTVLPWTARAALLLALALLSGCGRPLTPRQAADLFARVHRASVAQVVRGRFTTQVRVKDQVLRAEARVHRGANRSVTEYLSGRYQGWWVVEQDGLVWRVDPQGKPRPGQGLTDAHAPLRGRDVLRLRVLRSPGRRQIAGRSTERYTIRIPGRTRARAVLDVDTATGFPLSSLRYDARGQLVSRTVFSEVNFGGEPPPKVTVPEVAQAQVAGMRGLRAKPASAEELERALGGELLRPTALPTGFSPTGSYLRQTPRGPIAELRYSDGLRVMVLLQMRVKAPSGQPSWRPPGPAAGALKPGDDNRPWRKWIRPGAPKADEPSSGLRQALRSRLRGHAVRERRGDRLLIVAGDLEPAELQRVLDSIPASGPATPGPTRPQ